MATGDVADIQGRLRGLLPPWFPNPGSALIVDAVLQGIATILANTFALIQYARSQSRILSATGAWLDLIAWDYFGPRFVRFPGEADGAWDARIVAELVRARITRAAIQAALVELTGYPVRVIEASVLTDVGFWKVRGPGINPVSFWNVDAPTNPLRWSGRGLSYQFFIECVLPPSAQFGNNPMPAWGMRGNGAGVYSANWMLRGTAGSLANGSALIARGGSAGVARGAQAVYDLINGMRAAGITCWVKFVPVPTAITWDQPGATWDSGGLWDQAAQSSS